VARNRTLVDLLIANAAMQEADLPRFAYRVYLGGTNTFGSPWSLPATLPTSVRALFHRHRYALFAQRLNAALVWPRGGIEELCALALTFLLPPAATYFLKWRRRTRAVELMRGALGVPDSHAWLKGAHNKALMNALRVHARYHFC
jgi:hypothetical protein